MSSKVRVTDPYSGVTVMVAEGSPQAKAWGVPAAKDAEPKVEPAKRSPRKSTPKE